MERSLFADGTHGADPVLVDDLVIVPGLLLVGFLGYGRATASAGRARCRGDGVMAADACGCGGSGGGGRGRDGVGRRRHCF